MQTSLNDLQQLLRELHQNQTVGTSQILDDSSLVIISLILTRTGPTVMRTKNKHLTLGLPLNNRLCRSPPQYAPAPSK